MWQGHVYHSIWSCHILLTLMMFWHGICSTMNVLVRKMKSNLYLNVINTILHSYYWKMKTFTINVKSTTCYFVLHYIDMCLGNNKLYTLFWSPINSLKLRRNNVMGSSPRTNWYNFAGDLGSHVTRAYIRYLPGITCTHGCLTPDIVGPTLASFIAWRYLQMQSHKKNMCLCCNNGSKKGRHLHTLQPTRKRWENNDGSFHGPGWNELQQ